MIFPALVVGVAVVLVTRAVLMVVMLVMGLIGLMVCLGRNIKMSFIIFMERVDNRKAEKRKKS